MRPMIFLFALMLALAAPLHAQAQRDPNHIPPENIWWADGATYTATLGAGATFDFSGVTSLVLGAYSATTGTFNAIAGGDSSLGITGLPATSATGGAVVIAGGATTTGGVGGLVSNTGGAGAGADAGGASSVVGGRGGATGIGGAIVVTSGAGGATSGASGAVTLKSGTTTASSTSASGNVILQSGAGSNSTGATAGGGTGTLALLTGDGGTTATGTAGAGGAVSITSGGGGSASGAGTGGAGGALSLVAGNAGDAAGGTGGAAGAINVTAGNGALATAGGLIALTAGNGGATNAIGGALTLKAGGGAAGGTGAGAVASMAGGASGTGATGNGGAASVTGGAAASSNGTGGGASVVGGLATGTGTGGGITITGGASGGAGGTAGAIAIKPGAKAGGTGASMTFGDSDTTLVTFVTDGTGTAEVALPSASIDATEIVNVTRSVWIGAGMTDAAATEAAGALYNIDAAIGVDLSLLPVLKFDANPDATGDDTVSLMWVVPTGYVTDTAVLEVYWLDPGAAAEAVGDDVVFIGTTEAVAAGEAVGAAGTAWSPITDEVIDTADVLNVALINIEVEDIVIGDVVSLLFEVDESACELAVAGTVSIIGWRITWTSDQ